MSTWSERDHPRDWAGRFTHAAVSGWAEEMSHRLNIIGLRRGDRRPEGWEAAAVRTDELWNVPGRRASGERTDAEQAELEELEQAFETFRGVLRIQRDRFGRGNEERYIDPHGRRYDRYGRYLGGGSPLNGSGRVQSRTELAKTERWSRRREDGTSTPDDRERRTARDGGKIGRQYEFMDYEGGGAGEFLALMKRAKARARVEGSARQPVRRTPRGTRIEGWMVEASKRMGG